VQAIRTFLVDGERDRAGSTVCDDFLSARRLTASGRAKSRFRPVDEVSMTPHDDAARPNSRCEPAPASAHRDEPLPSEFAGDEEMTELIEYFLLELNQRIETIAAAWAEGDREQVCRIAHQLKGAAASYGYRSITDAAGALEQSLTKEEAELASAAEKLEDLVTLCRRAGGARQ
jgi:histidine phosphotransfer protein HptB